MLTSGQRYAINIVRLVVKKQASEATNRNELEGGRAVLAYDFYEGKSMEHLEKPILLSKCFVELFSCWFYFTFLLRPESFGYGTSC